MQQFVWFFTMFSLGTALLGACLPVIGQKEQSFFIVEWIFLYVNEVKLAFWQQNENFFFFKNSKQKIVLFIQEIATK